ncbi:COG1361 family protein [Paenibacillus hexagrammi]|uniref:DUF11 domain-containing protein n=1 Tax=Paenibacillus hexagrammi TaxID=2908839 RepID=A0ABY3SRR5_9BACL|nr:hypothetical protein [Paenibacillus sp. YPD9-1]UJF35800.1 hypothetical protein L0M14_12350 [Paenibacillus sp. YPD9-1]
MTCDSNCNNDQILRNQSVVRFSTGGYTGHAYSNVVLTPVNGPRLVVHISASECLATVGQTINYRIHIVNLGNVCAKATLLHFIPVDTRFVINSATLQGVPLPGVDPLQGIPLGEVCVGESGAVDVTFQVVLIAAPASGNLRNQVTVPYSFTATDGRTICGTVRSNTSTIPVQELKIGVLKTASADTVISGDKLTYYVRVINESDQLLESAMIRDSLPAGVTFIEGSVSVNHQTERDASPLTGIRLSHLPAKTSIEVAFEVMVGDSVHIGSDETTIANHAELIYSLFGIEHSLQSNTVETSLLQAKLCIVKSVNLAKATLGDTLCYTLEIVNEGHVPVDAVLTDILPIGSLFEWGSVSIQGVYQPDIQPSQGIRLGLIQPCHRIDVSFRVKVPTIISDPKMHALVNQAQLHYHYMLPDGRTIRSTLCSNTVTTQLFFPFINIGVTPTPTITDPGGIVTMTCRIINSGNLGADITLHDWIPEGAALEAGSIRKNGVPYPSKNDNHGLQIGALEPGKSIEITYILHVNKHPNTRFLTSHLYAAYWFELNHHKHSGMSYANEYRVWIEHWHE